MVGKNTDQMSVVERFENLKKIIAQVEESSEKLCNVLEDGDQNLMDRIEPVMNQALAAMEEFVGAFQETLDVVEEVEMFEAEQNSIEIGETT